MRAVVADDEPHARRDLVRALGELGVEVVAEAADGIEALRAAARERPDVLFLDVRMPGLDGLAAAARSGLPPVVFVTAHAEHAASAFDVEAADFVLKPVTRERLARAVARVARRVSVERSAEGQARLRVADARGVRFVDAHRVERFFATDKYVAFALDGEELLLDESLDALERTLDGAGFVRAHRAHLVRASAVARTDGADGALVLVLASGARVPVSKRQRAAVLRALRSA